MTAGGDICPVVRVDLWDVIQLISDIPLMRGRTCYAKAYRSAIADFYYWIEAKTVTTEGQNTCLVEFPRNLVLDHAKANIYSHLHQLAACLGNTSDEATSEQARVDAYSTIFDLLRQNI
jgi:hypothetical protein